MVEFHRNLDAEIPGVGNITHPPDGASAMIICTLDRARKLGLPHAIIRGIDHRIETHHLGARDLTTSVSTRLAGETAGVFDQPRFRRHFLNQLRESAGLRSTKQTKRAPRMDALDRLANIVKRNIDLNYLEQIIK